MAVEQTDAASVFIQLIPVIVGGLIGVVGGLAGPPLTHWLNQSAERKRKLAEKLEELLGALYEHHHWLGVVKDIRVFGHEDTQPPTPLPRARAIAAIYFPQFSKALLEIEVAAGKYEMWMFEGAKKRLNKEVDKLNDGLSDAYSPYSEKFAQVISDLRDYAKVEFKR